MVFLTGASSGIGRALVLALARDGFRVAGMARRQERLSELVAELGDLSDRFLPLVGDVTDREAVMRAAAAAHEYFGRLDVLVANAGIGQRGGIADADWSHIETVLRTNIDGVLHSIQATVPYMRQVGGGQVIVISSVAATLVSPFAATYAASKAFVSSIASSLRIELQGDNIRVTDVLVGRTHTEFNEKRLGLGKRTGKGVPTMSADDVAAGIVTAIRRPRDRVVLRLFDHLILLGNWLLPGLMGYLAARQYR